MLCLLRNQAQSQKKQACLRIENKILCIFGNLSPVFEFIWRTWYIEFSENY